MFRSFQNIQLRGRPAGRGRWAVAGHYCPFSMYVAKLWSIYFQFEGLLWIPDSEEVSCAFLLEPQLSLSPANSSHANYSSWPRWGRSVRCLIFRGLVVGWLFVLSVGCQRIVVAWTFICVGLSLLLPLHVLGACPLTCQWITLHCRSLFEVMDCQDKIPPFGIASRIISSKSITTISKFLLDDKKVESAVCET